MDRYLRSIVLNVTCPELSCHGILEYWGTLLRCAALLEISL